MFQRTALTVAISLSFLGPLHAAPSTVHGQTLANAEVRIYDSKGLQKTVQSDTKGHYQAQLDSTAPLMLVVENGKQQFVALSTQTDGNLNVNSLTDRIASDIAADLKLRGPVDLVRAAKAPNFSAEQLTAKTAALRVILAPALETLKLKEFNPLNTSASSLEQALYHNRGYDSPTGERGDASIYDSYYREVTKFAPFQLKQAQQDRQDIDAPGRIRVFVAGDSTASNYDAERLPRMGWGQVLQRQFKEGSPVRVLNLAQSGRSSRSFINEGWFAEISQHIRAGDYLLVQFGHNDEKCGNQPPAPAPSRDLVDIGGLCTYPGNDAAIPADMSFRKSLERYIQLAKSRGATPVLITPVTRRSFKDGRISSTTHTYSKGAFPGDYSQTVRDTAQANQVALVDLDKDSMAFFNNLGENGSLDYFLAVDTTQYPFYQNQTGSRAKPDNTHFQEKGAIAVSELIIKNLREQLPKIANHLK